ncbi:PAS domain S-box protein [Desulfolucanica intricata]|uniref:PAS domain S-box protein n=1 Tax=Desulfolucanica intricata TaxID=1285191 RepID=UPI00082A4439|nr:PAS domain S-box protein [Desulfolucanica intricata]
MVTIFILVISVTLQFIAAFLALRLIRLTGGITPWVLVALAVLLMAVRRSLSLIDLTNGYYPGNIITTEIVALIISILMVAGIARITPLFLSIKKSEENLRKSEANYRAIFDSASDAIILLDIKTGDIIDVNLKLCEMYGYTPEEVCRLKPILEKPPYTLTGILQLLKKIAKGEPHSSEWLCKDKSGTMFWGEAKLKQVTINGRECLLANIRDITLHKRAEEVLRSVNDDIKRQVAERTAELTKANEALRDSENRYRMLFNSGNDAVFVHRLTSNGMPGKFIEVNDVACKSLGYTREELLKLSPADIRISEKHYEISDAMKKLLFQKHVLFERVHITKDGKKFPVEINSHLFNLNGKPTILSIARNISERKQAEKVLRKALEESQMRETEMSELLKCAHAVLRYQNFKEAGQVILDSCKKLIGAANGYISLESIDGNADEVVAIQLENSFSNIPLPLQAMKNEAYQNQKPIFCNDFTNSKWKKSSTKGHLNIDNVVFVPMIIENQALGFLCLFNKVKGFTKNDIQLVSTLGKLAAIALYNSQLLKSLKNSEELFRSVAESATDAIIIVDSDKKIIFWNSAAETIFGHLSGETVGQPITIIIPEQYRELHKNTINCAILMEYLNITGKAVEMIGLRKDGSQFPVEVSFSKWSVRDNFYFTAIIRDITERKKIEEELQNTIIELKHTQNIVKEKEKLAIIGQMAAGMAHEIKNPLTAIRGLAHLIRKNYSGSETLVNHMNVILKEANQANNTITKFLQITQPRQLSLKLESVNSVVEECTELLNPQFINKNIKLKYEGTKELPQCMLDRDQLKQVLLNMCQNAIDAMAEGGVIIIKTDFLTDKKEVYIEIEDTGCGIPMEEIKNIGVPFYTTKADGMGLSLSSSYAIINAHNGRVEVVSKERKGTRFGIYLPCYKATRE